MAKKVKAENKIEEIQIGKYTVSKDYPEDKLDLLRERFGVAEKWEEKRRKLGPPFNEQFCADVYGIAETMTRDDSFKGKFDPEQLYTELCETMKDKRKGKKDYSLYDEVSVISKVMDAHRKKTKK